MSSTVRVLHVADGLSADGMTASDLCRLLTRWRSRHDPGLVRVGVATLRGWDPGVAYLEARGVSVRPLRSGHDGARGPDLTSRLAGIVREESYDLLHLHDVRAAKLGRVAAREAGVPCIVHQHEADAVQPRDVLAEAILRRQPDAGVAASQAVRDVMARGWRMSREQIRLIRDGVQLADYRDPDPDLVGSFRCRLRVSEGCALVGTVISDQTPEQARPLIGAAALLAGERPDLRTALVGSSEHRDDLERYARRIGISDRAIFTGRMRNPAPAIAALDVVVAPAPARDGEVSRLMARAMAAGTPLIVTRPEAREPISEPDRGWMLSPAGPDGLARAIGTLLDDPQMGAELAVRAREESSAFGLARCARELESLYVDLVTGGKGSESASAEVRIRRATSGKARPPAPPPSGRSRAPSGGRLHG